MLLEIQKRRVFFSSLPFSMYLIKWQFCSEMCIWAADESSVGRLGEGCCIEGEKLKRGSAATLLLALSLSPEITHPTIFGSFESN